MVLGKDIELCDPRADYYYFFTVSLQFVLFHWDAHLIPDLRYFYLVVIFGDGLFHLLGSDMPLLEQLCAPFGIVVYMWHLQNVKKHKPRWLFIFGCVVFMITMLAPAVGDTSVFTSFSSLAQTPSCSQPGYRWSHIVGHTFVPLLPLLSHLTLDRTGTRGERL